MGGESVEEQLIGLEHARCAAISAGDIDALLPLLSEHLSHTHTTGRTQDRHAYVSGLQGRPRATRRTDDLEVRVYGDAALMRGTIVNAFPPETPDAEPRRVELHALQVWAREDGRWELVAFASSGPRVR